MKKILTLTLCIVGCTLLLAGCSNENKDNKFNEPINPTEQISEETIDKYEPVARLYTEILWRDLEDSDDKTLNLCVDDLKEKIEQNAKTSSEARRKSEYYTKEEVSALIPTEEELGELYFEPEGVEAGHVPLDIPSVEILTKDKYEVKHSSDGKLGFIVLEDNREITVQLPRLFNGEYIITTIEETKNSRTYKVEIDENTKFVLYLDIDNGLVTRVREGSVAN